MQIEFSETSYSYAMTREVEKYFTSKGAFLLQAPHFPTLRQERKLGYDVRIEASSAPGPVILQFKRGEFISQMGPKSPTWKHARGKHFRIEFPPGHHQLKLLQDLENDLKQSNMPAVIKYLAPAFVKQSSFQRHFLNGEITKHSYGCSPSDVPADNQIHHLVFVPPGRLFVLSEPRELEPLNLFSELENLLEMSAPEQESQQKPEPGTAPQVPPAVKRISRFLEGQAEEQGIDVQGLREALLAGDRGLNAFEGRPDLQEIEFVTTLGLAMDIHIGFPATMLRNN